MGPVRFADFTLDADNRVLWRGNARVELSGRYFDALALLVRSDGALVSKERFFDEVWRGAAVTDEALTQCIKSLRQALGDKSSAPNFIETVPKHGYRFIAAVFPAPAGDYAIDPLRTVLALGAAGTLGATLAGAVGGTMYGAAAASDAGPGGVSIFVVLLWLTMMVAAVGGAGVSFGIAAACAVDKKLAIVGGALGGMLVGGIVKLLGLDAFNLLLGTSPRAMTGALEGLALGGGVGLAAALSSDRPIAAALGGAAAIGGLIGSLVTIAGGRMMAGSLVLLDKTLAGNRLNLGGFGEHLAVLQTIEGALFATCITGAMALARRRSSA